MYVFNKSNFMPRLPWTGRSQIGHANRQHVTRAQMIGHFLIYFLVQIIVYTIKVGSSSTVKYNA